MTKIKIKVGDLELAASLNDSDTATRVRDLLPLTAHANVWGDEVYFTIPLQTGPEDPQEVVEMGDIGYWPPGQAMCLFFGRTPVSRGSEIRPYSPVNVIGRMEGDPRVLKQVKEGDVILVQPAAAGA